MTKNHRGEFSARPLPQGSSSLSSSLSQALPPAHLEQIEIFVSSSPRPATGRTQPRWALSLWGGPHRSPLPAIEQGRRGEKRLTSPTEARPNPSFYKEPAVYEPAVARGGIIRSTAKQTKAK